MHQLDPHFTYAHALLGYEHVSREDYDDALRCFRNAIRMDPRHYNAWCVCGCVCRCVGACACACACARVHARACECLFVRVCVHVRHFSECVQRVVRFMPVDVFYAVQPHVHCAFAHGMMCMGACV